MSEIVKCVAKAIFAKMVANPRAYMSAFQDVTLIGDDERKIVGKATTIDGDFDLEDIARAVIAAMREPTEEMVAAAESSHDRCDGRTDMDDVWRAMIDEALK